MTAEHLEWLKLRHDAAIQCWLQGDGEFVMDVLVQDVPTLHSEIERLRLELQSAQQRGAALERAAILAGLDWYSWVRNHREIENRPLAAQ